MKIDVKGCARCGGKHSLEFEELTQPIIYGGKEIFTHFAMCPFFDEPILLYIVGAEDK